MMLSLLFDIRVTNISMESHQRNVATPLKPTRATMQSKTKPLQLTIITNDLVIIEMVIVMYVLIWSPIN